MRTKRMALCGVTAALAVVVMALGGVIPLAAYCCPVLAAVILTVVVELCGRRLAWAWYIAVAVLSCLTCADPECAGLFVCLGHYPIWKRGLDCIRPAPLRWGAKLVVFNLALALLYAALVFLLGLDQLGIQGQPLWLPAAWVVLGNLTFWLTDVVLTRLSRLLRRRLGR